MKPLAIDLFCGLGGWTEGLLAAGYYEDGRKNPGFRFDGSGRSFQTESVDRHVSDGRKFNPDRKDHATKNDGGSWFAIGPRGSVGAANNARDAIVADGRKGGGDWFGSGENCSLQRRASSGSSARKAASAKIAKIPLALSLHIAKVYLPACEAAA